MEALLDPLSEAGVDIFDESTRRFWPPEFEGSDRNLAGWAKKITGRTVMTAGSVGLEGPLDSRRLGGREPSRTFAAKSPQPLEMFGSGDFDIVWIGGIVMTNPEWQTIVRKGNSEDPRPYDPDAAHARLECADRV